MKTIAGQLNAIASAELVDVVGGSQAIEEWANDIKQRYHTCKQRPELMVLVVERYGECYNGYLYITKKDFKGG
jgi:hypothetical protein